MKRQFRPRFPTLKSKRLGKDGKFKTRKIRNATVPQIPISASTRVSLSSQDIVHFPTGITEPATKKKKNRKYEEVKQKEIENWKTVRQLLFTRAVELSSPPTEAVNSCYSCLVELQFPIRCLDCGFLDRYFCNSCILKTHEFNLFHCPEVFQVCVVPNFLTNWMFS